MANQLPTFEEAHSFLNDNVSGAHFFNKLASYGFVPQSREEAQAYLEMGETLMQCAPAIQQKQAQAQNSAVQRLNSELQNEVSRLGLVNKTAQTNDRAEWIASVAREALQHPDVYKAALAEKKAEADQAAKDIYNRYLQEQGK